MNHLCLLTDDMNEYLAILHSYYLLSYTRLTP